MKNKTTDYFPMINGKYLNLENNKLYTNPRTIVNYVGELGMTPIEYATKWNLLPDGYVIYCKICDKPCDSIGKHLNINHKDYGGINQYKKDYGDNVELISSRYKKSLSNNISGENNPNHKSNRNKLQRQQISPFSIEFYKKKYPNESDEQLNEILLTFKNAALSDRNLDTNVDYYIKQGFSLMEAKQLLNDRQTTFSLEICIEKYGEEKGLERWKLRQDKWMNTMNNKSDAEKLEIKKKRLNGAHYSKISQELFWYIHENFENNSIMFKELNNELFQSDKKTKNVYAYDYVDFTNKKIIEFNGDFWHCNPKQYNESCIHSIRKITAKEIWKYDKIKLNYMRNKGYVILEIWESDYKKDKEETLQRCIDFINNKKYDMNIKQNEKKNKKIFI